MSEKSFHKKRIGDIRYKYFADIIQSVIFLHPSHHEYNSILDIGCSVGELLKNITYIKKKVGIDCSEYAQKFWQCNDGILYRDNLEDICFLESFRHNNDGFDIITCFEVAEHLNNKYSNSLIQFIKDVSTSKTMLFFCAAMPHQPGRGHINCLWHIEWLNLLENYGWEYYPLGSNIFSYLCGKINKNGIIISDCYLNTMVFIRKDCSEKNRNIPLKLRKMLFISN